VATLAAPPVQPLTAARRRWFTRDRERDTWWFRLLDGFFLIGLLVCFVAGTRFDVARGTLLTLEQAASVGEAAEDAAAGWLEGWWFATILAGIACGCWVAARVYAITEADVVRPATRADDRRLAVLALASIAALLLWVTWQASGLLTLGDPDPPDAYRSVAPVLAAGSVLAALVALTSAGPGVLGDPGRAWKLASVVRIQLLVLAAVFAAVFAVPFTSAQVTDVLRAWGDGPHSRAAAGIAGALLLGALCRAGALRILVPNRPREVLEWCDTPVIVLALGFAVALDFAVLETWLVVALVVAAAAILAFTKRADPKERGGALADAADVEQGVRRLAGTLAVVPLGTLLAGTVSATTDSLLLPSSPSGEDFALIAWTAAICVLCGALAVVTHRRLGEAAARGARPLAGVSPAAVAAVGVGGFAAAAAVGLAEDETAQLAASLALGLLCALLAFRALGEDGLPELWGTLGVAAGTALAVFAEPIAAPRAFGTIGLVFVAAAGGLLVLHLLAGLAARRTPRPDWPWLPNRVPVVTLLAVWVAVAWLVAAPTFHQARTVPAGNARPQALGSAVFEWLDRQWEADAAAREADGGAPVDWPMLLVAASGGGSKAAYWTDLVLDCVLGDGEPSKGAPHECPRSGKERERLGRIFLTSSVSGGSVGVHHFVEHRDAIVRGAGWVDGAAGPELLSPVVGWGLFHDLPAFMLGLETDPRRCDDPGACRLHADRALVQEAAVAAREDIDPPDGGGLLAPAGEPPAPVTIFNGAVDGGSGRVLISPLALAPQRLPDPGCRTPPSDQPSPGSVDAHDVLARGEDVPRVTAAVLSARFPGVAPAGRLGATEADPDARGCKPPATLPPVLVRDGGYMENSGLLTIAELLPDTARAVRRWRERRGREHVRVQYVVVSIDDDPAVLDGDPKHETRPRDALGIAKQAGPAYLTRQTRDRIQSCRFRDVAYVQISPRPHIGAQAATGWELSSTVRREDLAAALRTSSTDAHRRIARLRDIVDGVERSDACPAPP
jgi:hypothetical protein